MDKEKFPKSWSLITMYIDDTIELRLTVSTDESGNFYLKNGEKTFPITYEEAKKLINMNESSFNVNPDVVASDMHTFPEYNNLVRKKLSKYESEDEDLKRLSKLLKGSLITLDSDSSRQVTELREKYKKLQKQRKQLINIMNNPTGYNLEKVVALLAEIEKEIQRIRKALSKFGSHKLPLTVKTPVVRIKEDKESKLTSVFENVKLCDYNEYEKLWNDVENYGPIASTLIYLGCLKDKISMHALKRTWIDLKRTIKTNSRKHFSEQYKLLVDQTYQYCSNNYNFLVSFYEKGICNCECGSFLSFIMTRINPGPITFAIVVPQHILILQSVPHSTVDKWIEFETTVPGGLSRPLEPKNLLNLNYAIFSDQIMALSILISSARFNDYTVKSIVGKMLGIDFTTMTLDEILRKADRRAVKTPLESNTFDILLFREFTQNDLDKVYKNNRKYIYQDMMDIVNGKQFSPEILKARAIQHRSELNRIYNLAKL